MLKLSNRGIYGIKALYELALNFGEGPVSIRSISERHGLPTPFLEQVLHALKQGGLVKSRRGVNGGYVLSRSPREITIGDAVRTLEGPIALCDCLQNTGRAETGERMKHCVTSTMYSRLSGMVERAFDTFTLADLAEGPVESTVGGTCNERAQTP